MPQQIRTQWHKIIPLIDEDSVFITAPNNGVSPHWGKFKPRPESLKAVLRQMATLPKFVIDDDLMKLATRENFQQSIFDMQKAGVLRLPFPAMVVEFAKPNGRALVVVRDNAFPEQMSWEENGPNNELWERPFYGIPFRIEQDGQGPYLVISPGVSTVSIIEQNGAPWLEIASQGWDIVTPTDEVAQLIKETYVKDSALIWYALAGAFLLMHTDGVKREVVDCSKINRKRVAAHKESIPHHVVLSIGRVYRSSTSEVSDEYVARRSPIPHWRRGFLKGVRFGKNREQIKQMYFHPRLVAFKESDGTAPASQEYYVKP